MEKIKGKVGMCTFYDDNFGTCLQAFALQRIISKYVDSVEIVRYTRNIKEKSNIIRRIFSKNLKQILGSIKLRKRIILWKKAFSEFRTNRLVFSDENYSKYDDLTSIQNKYDAFVCGSDMLWSEEFYDDWKFYYLGFAPKSKSIAYSPSFGKNEIYDEHIQECRNYIENIGYISCREEAGVELIESLFEASCPQTLDPTLLLSREEWNEIIGAERLVQDKYVLTYLFGGIKGERKILIDNIKNKKNLRVIHIPMTLDEYNKDAYKEKMGPLEFVKLFRDADAIVTDTFHGTIFSIIFNKEFWVLDRNDKSKWAKYADRMTSTLKMFGLSERYITDCTYVDLMRDINWDLVEQKIKKKREYSLRYLKESLEKSVNA